MKEKCSIYSINIVYVKTHRRKVGSIFLFNSIYYLVMQENYI